MERYSCPCHETVTYFFLHQNLLFLIYHPDSKSFLAANSCNPTRAKYLCSFRIQYLLSLIVRFHIDIFQQVTYF
jgi:hypothetical protein